MVGPQSSACPAIQLFYRQGKIRLDSSEGKRVQDVRKTLEKMQRIDFCHRSEQVWPADLQTSLSLSQEVGSIHIPWGQNLQIENGVTSLWDNFNTYLCETISQHHGSKHTHTHTLHKAYLPAFLWLIQPLSSSRCLTVEGKKRKKSQLFKYELVVCLSYSKWHRSLWWYAPAMILIEKDLQTEHIYNALPEPWRYFIKVKNS